MGSSSPNRGENKKYLKPPPSLGFGESQPKLFVTKTHQLLVSRFKDRESHQDDITPT